MKNHQTNKQTHRPLFIIIALSILPIILAILFYKIRYVGAGYTNHGTLLTPPLQLNTFKLIDCQNQHKQWFFEPGKWRLIYLAPQKCDPGCLNNLTQLNQVYRALGKRQNRVQTVAIFYPQSYPQSLPKYVSISCQTSKNAQLQKKTLQRKKTNPYSPTQSPNHINPRLLVRTNHRP